MVSIRKYLEMRGPDTPPHAEMPGVLVLVGLCVAMLDQIAAYAVGGDSASELRVRLDNAKSQITVEMGENPAASVAEDARSVLAAWAARERESAQRTAVETQHVVGVLNQALMVLAGGNERSVARLQRIQASLQRTALVRDNEGLRTSLADAVKLIHEEAAHEQECGERDLADFEAQVVRVRENLAANPVRRLPGRAHAIRALGDALSGQNGTACYVAAFSIEQIRALVQRYGPEPVEELFFQIIRERVQPVAPTCSSWRWSAGCLIAIFEHPLGQTDLQNRLAVLCRVPMVYRMTLGSRTAVMKVAVSHMVILLAETVPQRASEHLQAVISQLDRFGGAESRNAA